jgi:oligosaccharide translocation protein RFT1
LTQGDAFLIALFTSLSSQGIYALASNYGSLLARMVFQPIEESSRGVFGRLLSAQGLNDTSAASALSEKDLNPSKTPAEVSKNPNLLSAHSYLLTILHLYTLLSLILVSLLPTLAPLALLLAAGPRWASTEAPDVLGLYAYYLPLLAFNGILEAFVTAVATPAELQRQAGAMMGFSAGFAAAGYLLLNVAGGGAKGLVGANAVNMGMRILWSWGFVSSWFEQRGVRLHVAQFLPKGNVMGMGAALAAGLRWWLGIGMGKEASAGELVVVIVLGAVYGLLL